MSTTSQVIFNVDSKLKNLAMKKAKSQGLPFSSVLKFVIQRYVQGQFEVGLVDTLNPKALRSMIKAEKDFAMGKNISPVFSSADEMIEHLRK